jgi:hypothetical protein
MISAGYIQKTIKADLHVRSNNAIPPWNLHEKVLEDSRRLSTEVDLEGWHVGLAGPTCKTASFVGPSVSLPIAVAIPHRLLGCIYVVP